MNMNYLLRLAQTHETFRRPELEALAALEDVRIEILDYLPDSPFCIIRFELPPGCQRKIEDVARSYLSRSIMARGIYELWGIGTTYDQLHADVKARTSELWQLYTHDSFKFTIDTFLGKRSSAEQRTIIESFSYMGFQGKILMRNPDHEFVVFEEFDDTPKLSGSIETRQNSEEDGFAKKPKRLFLGRYIGGGLRHLIDKHDLKKRPYISTTSMDAELALITASLALAAPGKVFLDPFVGTGGFMIAASELGAFTFGADIDGRSFRGKGKGIEKGVGANLKKYGLESLFGDCISSDMTNTPLRIHGAAGTKGDRWVDGIIADPPYGVREGMKVLGTKPGKVPMVESSISNGTNVPVLVQRPHYIDGVLAHTLPDYIAPKRQYSFICMLDDILDFAARTLIDGGRLAFWMPSANELDQELALPTHPLMELKHVCVQVFNKWSRRLLVFERVKGNVVDGVDILLNRSAIRQSDNGVNADDLNPFRKMYFQGFQSA